MTVSPYSSPLELSSFEDALDAIRAGGHRVSAARRLVLRALFGAEGPVSAEYIAAGLGGRLEASDVTSVYRNLEQLEEMGIVRHVHLGHGPGLYTLVGGGEREYLACERCDRVQSVDPTQLDEARGLLRERFGFEARFTHFPILGLCDSCLSAEAGEKDAGGKRMFRRRHEHQHEHNHGDMVHSHPHGHGSSGADHHHSHSDGDS